MKGNNQPADSTKHVLFIEFGYRNYTENENRDFGVTKREVIDLAIPNNQIVGETIEYLATISSRAREDVENVRRCTEFIDNNFPHAIYSVSEDEVSVDNLTEEEMKICSIHEGLRFEYLVMDDN
jgi:hypothetical protein